MRTNALVVLVLWFPVFLCMGLIFYASSLPAEEIPVVFSFQDLVYHLVVYALLGFLVVRALKNSFLSFSLLKVVILSCVLSFLYAGTDELHQLFVLNRTCSFLDFIIDCAGVLLGILLYSRLISVPRKKSNDKSYPF